MIELTVVIPTYNERDNVADLLALLDKALQDVSWEAVFVDDDSPDGTAALVREIGQTRANVRCIQRIGRRGLSRAVVEGMLSSNAPYMAVIDADLQHDESLLPLMLHKAKADQLDLVVGSRYVQGGSLGEWDSTRAQMSKLATRVSRLIVKDPLSDPMSGFFLVSRPAFESAVRNLSGEGFKILLDLFASSTKPLRFAELPYTFRKRRAGESKLDSAVLWEYLLLIIDKMVGRWIPARFVMFSAVGATGLVVHFATLALMFRGAAMDFTVSEGVATVVAMTSNFALNNAVTYRDRRKKGWAFVTGLLSFYLICGLGVVGNVGVANFIFVKQYSWLLAGFVGALVGTVWNYAASAIFTWGRR